MTISGKVDPGRLLSQRVVTAFAFLLTGAGGFVFFFYVVRLTRARRALDPLTEILVL
jgi:hypothetical protein